MTGNFEVPKEWKPASTGEEELDWLLYDTEADGDAGNELLTFFDTTEAAVDETDTNMQIGGQLPSNQRFLVKEIHVEFDTEIAANDLNDLADKASLELSINNKRMIVGPLTRFISGPKFAPAGVTLDENFPMGDGFILDKGIVIPGGTPFKVLVRLGDTAASAAMNIFVILRGRLVRKA